jgi:hypothetical protein
MLLLKVNHLYISFVIFFCILGSASSGNPNLFPQNLTNYYTNVFNPNVNTQFLQNANPPPTITNPNIQQQINGPMGYAGILVSILELLVRNFLRRHNQ